MKASDFVHLHCHSTYSLLEALPSPQEIVLRAKELGQNAVGLADKGYTYGLIEFYKIARECGIKPILGCEVYCAARARHDKDPKVDTKRYPLTLLCETQEGYQNLLQLCTHAALEGMYYKPRVDEELLQQYGKGLIALSGPIGGAIPQAVLSEDEQRLQALVESYQGFFGKDNLYFEIMDLPHVPRQQEANAQLVRWGRELKIPLVVTCNSHYVRREDAEAHDVLLCIQKNANVHDTNRFSMLESDFSMRSFEELERAFAHVPEALENARRIADRCEVTFGGGEYRIPKFTVPSGETEESALKQLCLVGMQKKYPKSSQEVQVRLEYELSVIGQMGFSGYFLIVADFVRYAKEQGITVGPGRGSAAGSIVSYCLDITTLDPLKHGLLFERFLNPERISMPDIDLDFADTRRDEVLNYVAQKYGRDHVVQICTFGTLAARAAVKDVGRAYGVPFAEMNELAKLIPERPGTLLKEALANSVELKAAYESNETYRKIIETALKLEGKARHVSVHACGVIITEKPTVEYTALQRAPKDDETIITQYAAKPLESLGLLKMDFLGLKNLTIIQTTLQILERLHGRKIDISAIPVNDRKTFALLSRAETMGVFQLESGGMRRYLKQLKPTQFGDITAMVALYRPGPMEWITRYIKRKHGAEEVQYLHPDVKEIFEETYGIGVYQEQILQLARTFAGYTLGEADILRKAIGKKIKRELDAQEEKFIAGAVAKRYSRALAAKIFNEVILPFAGYGFPKAHAASYARVAYETAYLKAHEPTAFMAAMLSADADDTDRVALEIEECRAMSIEVLPPDINESLAHFTALPDGRIRFGLTAIKGVGESSVRQIIGIREQGGKFSSIEDFAKRVPARLLNKKLIEALAKSGALDSLCPTGIPTGAERATFVEHYDKIVEFSRASGDVGSSQTDLFCMVEDQHGAGNIEFPAVKPVPLTKRLQWEKETLGLYVSSHPLAGLRKYIGKKAMLIADFTREHIGRKVTVAGIVEGMKRITTKKGDTMAVVFLEDPTGKIEVTLFPRTFAQATGYLEDADTVLVVGGTLDERGGQLQIRADAVKKASLSKMVERAKEEGFFDEEEERTGVRIQRVSLRETEILEMVDEEGNVIAGETVVLDDGRNSSGGLVGDLASFVAKGMPVEEAVKELGDVFSQESTGVSSVPRSPSKMEQQSRNTTHQTPATHDDRRVTAIHIHTLELPEQAPKQLLLDLKGVLERFPGKERIQFKIGSQVVPLALTVTMSTILEKKIDEVMLQYSAPARVEDH